MSPALIILGGVTLCVTVACLFVVAYVLHWRVNQLETTTSSTLTLVDGILKLLEAKQESDDNELAQWAEHNGFTERQKENR